MLKLLRSGRFYTLLLNLIFVSVTLADNPSLDVKNIPDSIRQHAVAVLRFSTMQFEVKSVNQAKLYKHYAITVFEKDAARFAQLMEVYEPLNQIKKIRGYIYDEHGVQRSKIAMKDIKDYSAVQGGTLYSDDRIKFYDPDVQKLPYTVEYIVEREYSGLLYYPKWIPQPAYNYGVEDATFTIDVPENMHPRYREVNVPECKVNTLDGRSGYTWKVSTLAPLTSEPLSIPLLEIVPVVYTAPTWFSYGHYSGDMSSWKGIADWIRKLNQDRQDLSPETVIKIKSMVSDTDDITEKVRKIYDYVQHHTRYVSVQLGIGGFQPWPASFVDEHGYGDCKALVNYAAALLNVIGIPSGYTLVRAGENVVPLMEDFPSMQFNHVILTVPVAQDTLWLECTSQTIPFDYIGSFSGNRTGLMITKNGENIIDTRKYRKIQNLQIRKGDVRIDEQGNASAALMTTYKGLQFENVNSLLLLGEEEQKKVLYRYLDIPDFVIDRVSYSTVSEKKGIPAVTEDISCQLNHMVTFLQQRAILPVNLMNKVHYVPVENGKRKTDFELTFPYMDYDTIRYLFPDNIIADRIPSPVHIETPFGTYDASIESEDNGLLYIRSVSSVKGRFPASQYGEYVEFRKQMLRADNRKVLLKVKPQ